MSKETIAYKFWHEFQEERSEIQNSIKELSKKPKPSIPTLCENLLQRIDELEKKATDATTFLPAYDQRQSHLQIKSLIEELNIQKSLLAPKSKFSFKSKKAAIESKSSLNEEKSASTAAISTSTTTTSTDTDATTKVIDEDNFQTVVLNNQENTYIDINSFSLNNKMVDFQFSNLNNCIINLFNSNITIGAINIKGLRNTIIMSGPVGSSILIYDCEKCIFLFRMHTSKQISVYLHVTSNPIIEDCEKIQFGFYALTTFPELDKMFETVKLDLKINKYDKVDDFNWLKQQASPNWKIISPEHIIEKWPLVNNDNNINVVETIENLLKSQEY
ncbi:22446_t:CDS:2 [Entrophospora sp. SA101]|nr:7801_t:CDS:2 [Entrophospora sp. SA101]CAJ0630199.1 12825_t:CDS:2 [Entrophospora sp. SA101]CAJ0768161.1 22446_t:CDS:2 [Entrophospora sp. SA101]CAJ0847498.1 6967_t:CDS:2 [Entrophospora sp. SA101]CAJ0847729.1 10777_t:CDS:2 [Entrophospora sp. SA101]